MQRERSLMKDQRERKSEPLLKDAFPFFYNPPFPLVGNLFSERNHAERRQERFRTDPRQNEDKSRNNKIHIQHSMNEHPFTFHGEWTFRIPVH
jgi:hypothetical protein